MGNLIDLPILVKLRKQLTAEIGSKQNSISDLDTIRSGASAGATAYQKPSTGIPKTDLASAAQTSLGKADSALQSHQDISHLAVQSVVDALIAELHSEIDSVATRDFLRELVAEHISTNTLGADYITANTLGAGALTADSLKVSGELRATNKRVYFGTASDTYIELGSDGYFHFPKKVYFDEGIYVSTGV